jgi:hypothetical protein
LLHHHGVRALVLSSFLLPLAAVHAQSVASVRFANRGPAQHRGWAVATVPFAPGVFPADATFGAKGLRSEMIPFGARWPDGSWRYAQLRVRLDQPAYSEQLVEVERKPGPDQQPFVWSPWLQHGISRMQWHVAVGVPGLGVRSAGLRLHAVLQASGICKVLHFRDRIPDTGLVYDLWVTAQSDADWLEFELRVTSSDPRRAAWHEDIDWMELWTSGGLPLVRGGARRGVYPPVPLTTGGPNRLRLLGPTRLFDGQGHEWWGSWLCYHWQVPVPDREIRAQTLYSVALAAPYGCALNWSESGAFGPFGVVPSLPPWIHDGGRQAARTMRLRYETYVDGYGNAWDDLPLGMLAKPGTTGDQPDFGVNKLGDVFASGMPDRIEEVRFNACEEANRPVHHREVDGSPVLPQNHPYWVPWGGRTHFNIGVSPDRLGKPFPEPYLEPNGWLGRDHQHWSSLTLASAYLLTGSWSLREELDVEADLYIASHTVPSWRQVSTNHIDQPRAVGRTFLSMSWNWLCTGRDDLRTRMLQRVDECVLPQHLGISVGGQVRPLTVVGPDGRTIAKYVHWKPWEEALAVTGLEAVYRVTGHTVARALAVVTAKNLVEHGWKLDANESIIATGVKWNDDGSRLSDAEYADPEKVLWSYGTGFNLWALPSVKLAIRYAQMLGDVPLELRARTIAERMYAGRTPPQDQGWDRFADWDAIW